MDEPTDEIAAARLARRKRRRRILRAALAITLAATTTFLIYFRRPLFQGNRGVVDAGLVYREAQPVGDVAGLIRTARLASILNLRGGGPDDPWYAAEVEAARAAGVDFYDLPMSATKRPTRRELLTLLDVFSRCKYPLLIHCKSGSDRTGLAAGLYLMTRRGVPPRIGRGVLLAEPWPRPALRPRAAARAVPRVRRVARGGGRRTPARPSARMDQPRVPGG